MGAITDDLLRAGLVSFMLPLAIALYSHEIAESGEQSHERQQQSAQSQASVNHAAAPVVVARQVDIDTAPQLPWEQPAPLTPAPAEPSTSIEAPVSALDERNEVGATVDAGTSAKDRAFQLLDEDSDISNSALAALLGISPGSARTYRSEWRKRQLTVPTNGVAH